MKATFAHLLVLLALSTWADSRCLAQADASEISRFAFGTPESVLRSGFTKVTVSDAFRPGKGYGFQSTEGLLAFDRDGSEIVLPEDEYTASAYGAYRTTSDLACALIEGDFDTAELELGICLLRATGEFGAGAQQIAQQQFIPAPEPGWRNTILPSLLLTVAAGDDVTPHRLSSTPAGKRTIKPRMIRSRPLAVQSLGAVVFDVRGVVQLRRLVPASLATISFWAEYPTAMAGIPVRSPVKQVHLLLGALRPVTVGTAIATVRWHYVDRTQRASDILYGEHVRSWWVVEGGGVTPKATVAWQGSNPTAMEAGTDVRAYQTALTNARPEVAADTLEIRSRKTPCALFVIAITIEYLNGSLSVPPSGGRSPHPYACFCLSRLI